jgi:putative acetyltransferase
MNVSLIRQESAADIPQIFAINQAAFGRPDEALLVDRLRARKAFIYSLVAVQDGTVAGHALFSPMMIQEKSGTVSVVCALGPVAVLPGGQNQGIGSALIEAGIERCRKAGYPLMIVLGHPDYYPHFGFKPAADFNIVSAYDVPREAFMVLELQKGALNRVSGVAHYHPEFDGV